MKKKLTWILIVVLVLWIIAGISARRDLRYLIACINSNKASLSLSQDGSYSDDFALGPAFYNDGLAVFGDTIWLDDENNAKMWRLILDANVGVCESSDSYFMNTDYAGGRFYIVPRWTKTLGLTSVLLPFLPRIEMFYWPSKKLLYLSEDIEEFGYDYSEGLNVTNVSEEVLGILRKNHPDTRSMSLSLANVNFDGRLFNFEFTVSNACHSTVVYDQLFEEDFKCFVMFSTNAVDYTKLFGWYADGDLRPLIYLRPNEVTNFTMTIDCREAVPTSNGFAKLADLFFKYPWKLQLEVFPDGKYGVSESVIYAISTNPPLSRSQFPDFHSNK